MRGGERHPDPVAIQDYVQRGVDAGHVGAHIQACSLCATLALTFRQSDPRHVADPTLYEDKRLFRTGGMGKTFTARDARIGREVIIKEPADPPHGALAGATLRMERRLLRERRILGLMEHPAVVPVYETGQWPDGTPFFAMRRIHGPTLAEVIAEAPDFPQRIVLLPQFGSLTEAIGHAHQRGIVHRDLTPDNMMFGSFGEPYVIDWGIATLLSSADDHVLDTIEPAADGLTRAGVGKEPYAPVEQLLGQPATLTFDVYSLGVTLHHLLNGRAPRQLHTGALEELPKECPEELVSIVRRATSTSPQNRFADAAELARELRRYQEGKLVAAHRYSLRARTGRWARRHRSLLALLAAACIATVAGLVANASYQQKVEAEREAHRARAAAQTASQQRQRAENEAAAAEKSHSEANKKWAMATARSRKLTLALERERRLSAQDAEGLSGAIEAERDAAKEAMEARLVAENARHEAEAAAERARIAEQEALSQARDAEAAREAAEARAEVARLRAETAEAQAARAELRARAAELSAHDAALEVEQAQRAAEDATLKLRRLQAQPGPGEPGAADARPVMGPEGERAPRDEGEGDGDGTNPSPPSATDGQPPAGKPGDQTPTKKESPPGAP